MPHYTRIIILLVCAAVSSACGAASSAATAPTAAAVTPGQPTAFAPVSIATPLAAATATPRTLAPQTASPPAGASATPGKASAGGYNPATTTIRLEKTASGLRAPTDIKAAGDGSGRLFVTEKAGTIRSVRNGVVSASPFLDITPLVRSDDSERGLLGVAFHPKYRSNGQFFVYYTEQSGDIILARYTVSADANRADPASALELLHIQHRGAPNHNGGSILFGPDGYLYIGTGDGGGAGDRFGNSQNPGALLAKLLRIDVDGGKPYGIPPSNPFVSRAGFRPEIWAWGLRNPWRFSFDRATGDLYIADVGQDTWEEVDLQPAGSKGGENYGWNKLEGTHCYPPGATCSAAGTFVLPIAEYDHQDGDCSITGGYIYRGAAQPALNGAYLFADYCTGHFRALQRGADGRWNMIDLLTTRFTVSSFGEDESGEVYVLNFGAGDLYHIVGAAR
jgi:glucose/arabinose dehydrogenase